MLPERKEHPNFRQSPHWVIFDLDGTLADITHRLHHITTHLGVEKDWDKFNSECSKDDPKPHIVEMLKMVREFGKSVAIFTGRNETTKERTLEWFDRNGIKFDLLEMRKAKDHRSDVDVKREMFEKYFDRKQIWFVVEDRDKMVDLWREIGLTCLQCQKGDY